MLKKKTSLSEFLADGLDGMVHELPGGFVDELTKRSDALEERRLELTDDVRGFQAEQIAAARNSDRDRAGKFQHRIAVCHVELRDIAVDEAFIRDVREGLGKLRVAMGFVSSLRRRTSTLARIGPVERKKRQVEANRKNAEAIAAGQRQFEIKRLKALGIDSAALRELEEATV